MAKKKKYVPPYPFTIVLKNSPDNIWEHLDFTKERQQKAIRLSDQLIVQKELLYKEQRALMEMIYQRRDILTDEMTEGKRAWGNSEDDELDRLYTKKQALDDRRNSLSNRIYYISDVAQAYTNRTFRWISEPPSKNSSQ